MVKDILNQNIKKVGKIDVKNTAYPEGVKRTNIEFANLDNNTAFLQFKITKDNVPAIITKKNAYIYAYFKSSKGNAREAVEVDYTEAMNGILSIQLDNDYLKAVTGQKVYGELYVTLHQWNEVNDGFSDTVVLSKFDFKVKDALINSISGVTKTEYIRMFDKLRDEVKVRMKEMEEDIGAIATLKQEITDLVTNSKNDIDKLSKDTIQELNDTSSNNLYEIDEKLKIAKSNIDDSILNYKESVKNIRDGFQKFIDENEFITTQDFDGYKIEIKELTESFSSNIQAIKEELQDDISQQIDNKIVDLDWQKYKFTENDGTVMSVPTNTDMNELKAGMYESSGFINDPLDDPGFYEVTVTESYNSRKAIYALHSYSNRMFVKTFHSGGEERNWKELTTNITDTGWVPFQLINGTIANNAFKSGSDNGIDCSYRIITNGSVTEKRVRINAENIVGTQQIATLPEGFAKNVQFHLVRVPIHRGQGLIGIFPSGSVYAYVENDKRDNWRDTDYFYGEIGWKE